MTSEVAGSSTARDETVEYSAEIRTGDGAEEPDTEVQVTPTRLSVIPISGKETESTLEFSIGLEEIDRFQCDGFFGSQIRIEAGNEQYTIPASDLDTVRFAGAVVENSHLTNTCEQYGFGRMRFSVCKWSTAIGAALVLVGIAFSITMIGILIGLPFIGVGAALLGFAFLYKKLGDLMEDNVWTRPDVTAKTT